MLSIQRENLLLSLAAGNVIAMVLQPTQNMTSILAADFGRCNNCGNVVSDMEVLLLDYNLIYQQNMGCEKLSKKLLYVRKFINSVES